jgi:class 3 adenylate cyclase
MADDIAQWLEDLGLGQYVQAFAENRIDLDILPSLSDDDLRELGLKLGDRRRVQRALEPASSDEPAAPAPTNELATPSADAERRQLTVMFCDLVGSTELASRFDPEDLSEIIGRFRKACAQVITRYDGYIAKYMGDGILVYFGYPQGLERDAERAARSGLGIVAAIAELNEELRGQEGPELAVRIGIDTGPVVVGEVIGENYSEELSVVGETPNIAARLQGLAQPNQVLLGPLTRELVGRDLDCEDLGTHQLKGIAAPVQAWRVVAERESNLEDMAFAVGVRLVGRGEEIGLLMRSWEQVREGRGHAVLINGEPGIGKSALVEAISAKVREAGFVRVAMRCSPYHTNSALYPVIEHLKRFSGWQPEDKFETRLDKLEEAFRPYELPLDEIMPLFAALLSLPVPEGRYHALQLTPQQQKQQTLDGLVAWTLEAAEKQPFLQVWEDLHWADPTTVEYLGLLLDQAPTASLLLALTYRPDFVPPWPTRSHMTPITLNRLERAQAEAMVRGLAGDNKLPSEVLNHIVDKTDGVPLYVEELTKMLLESDLLRREGESYVLTGPLTGIAIPATLQESLLARLDRLPTVREVAQLGAVLGREFAYETLKALGSIEDEALQDGLGRLVEAELLYQRGRPPRSKYIFKHALVQDAAYQSLLRRTRQHYHKQVAELLEASFPETVEGGGAGLGHLRSRRGSDPLPAGAGHQGGSAHGC